MRNKKKRTKYYLESFKTLNKESLLSLNTNIYGRKVANANLNLIARSGLMLGSHLPKSKKRNTVNRISLLKQMLNVQYTKNVQRYQLF